jgi:hypothetical protein
MRPVATKMLTGQSPAAWERVCDNLAHGFGASLCRVRAGAKPRTDPGGRLPRRGGGHYRGRTLGPVVGARPDRRDGQLRARHPLCGISLGLLHRTRSPQEQSRSGLRSKPDHPVRHRPRPAPLPGGWDDGRRDDQVWCRRLRHGVSVFPRICLQQIKTESS